jgi:Mitochondrial carrier protein
VVQAYPLDLVRTRLAAQTTSNYYHGISNSLLTIVRDEGVLGLYRGLGATLFQVAPSLAINYCAYETLRSHWLSLYPERKSPTVRLPTPSKPFPCRICGGVNSHAMSDVLVVELYCCFHGRAGPAMQKGRGRGNKRKLR